MATTMTLLELQTAVRQRADMVNSTFISDSELTSYINQSYFELYDLIVTKYGNNYYAAQPYQFTTDGTNQFYDLPANFYKLLGVDLALSNSQDSFVTLKPFNFIERNRYSVPNFQSFYGVTNMRYRIQDDQLWLNPLPAAGQLIQLWYVPVMVTLSAPTDTVQGVSGWTEYIIVDAAIKCLQKEESDVSVLMAQKQALITRIDYAAENRDAGSPATVSDSRMAFDGGGFDGMNGSGWGY